ncbi:hypothetical protein AB5N19_05318 [Seiridium cardinale]
MSPPLIRLSGIPLAQLPSPTASPDALSTFVLTILREALPFIDSASPTSGSSVDPKLWKHKGDKTSPDSAAKVEAWERVCQPAGTAEKETWALRKSVHEDRAETGTASWAEFERCFRDEHAEAEDAFTPNVLATHEALAWDCAGISPTQEGGQTWGDFRLRVEEMRHKIGKPLKDRTFPVLQLTAGVEGGHEFVVVSIPVPDFGSSESSKLAREKTAQVAYYVSVERIRKLADGKIEWLMATASDAGGVLPQFVQNLAMPGVVWKDVPLFLAWIAKERQKRDVARDGVFDKGRQTQAQEPAGPATASAADPQPLHSSAA